MKNDKRVRINKRMMAYSNGQRTNIIPSVRQMMEDRSDELSEYRSRVREGYEVDYGTAYMARIAAGIDERVADEMWDNGKHLYALNLMLNAAIQCLPDDEPEYEDVHWLDPEETIYWHPNVQEFVRMVRRCRELCHRDPRLWPIYDTSLAAKMYDEFRTNLDRFFHTT